MHLRTQKPQGRTTLHSLAIALDFAEFCYSALTSFHYSKTLLLLLYPPKLSLLSLTLFCFVSFILIMYTIWHID